MLMMMSCVDRVQTRPVRLLEQSKPVSLSCLINSRETAESKRCRVSGATGANDYTPTSHVGIGAASTGLFLLHTGPRARRVIETKILHGITYAHNSQGSETLS